MLDLSASIRVQASLRWAILPERPWQRTCGVLGEWLAIVNINGAHCQAGPICRR